MAAFWFIAPLISQNFTDISEELIISVIKVSIIFVLVKEAVRTSGTSVKFYEATRSSIPTVCHLHTPSRENQKSHLLCPAVRRGNI
jgi:hypothetical protein